jgi:hypothetical protein
MGAGASSTALAPPAKFQTPVVREDENGDPRSLFFCVPMDDKVKAKALQVRPGSEGSWFIVGTVPLCQREMRPPHTGYIA